MYQHAYEQSSLNSADANMEQYFRKLKAERELYEAIDTLNSTMYGVTKNMRLKMGELLNEVFLVNVQDNSILRILQKDEVLAIHTTLKRLLDLNIH